MRAGARVTDQASDIVESARDVLAKEWSPVSGVRASIDFSVHDKPVTGLPTTPYDRYRVSYDLPFGSVAVSLPGGESTVRSGCSLEPISYLPITLIKSGDGREFVRHGSSQSVLEERCHNEALDRYFRERGSFYSGRSEPYLRIERPVDCY